MEPAAAAAASAEPPTPLHELVAASARRCALLAGGGDDAQLDAAALPAQLHTPGPAMWTAAFAWAAEFTNAAGGGGRQLAPPGGGGGGLPADLRPHLRLRCAVARDAPVVLHFVRELAAFEREPDAVATTADTFARDGLPPRGLEDVGALAARPPQFHVLLAELPAGVAALVPPSPQPPADGGGGGGGGGCHGELPPPGPDGWVPCAMALAHPSYSTWTGRTLYLEDLYVSPQLRRRGASKLLLLALARAAVVARCARLQWSVLAWNSPAVRAYEALDAELLGEWRLYRVSRGRPEPEPPAAAADAAAAAAAGGTGGGGGLGGGGLGRLARLRLRGYDGV
jgi:GNAT superfamily N-acetyltransferase